MEILLLHGLIGSLNDSTIVDSFKCARVHAPDLLGYGMLREYSTEGLTLTQQSEHIARYVSDRASGPVHVVGHSVGGAVGLLFASDYPSLVKSYTSVEGNMTLKDAFWSANISARPVADIEAMLVEYRSNVAAWIEGAGVIADQRTIQIAKEWLANQPAKTIRAQANAVVQATADSSYLARFDVLSRELVPIYLLAGEKSTDEWDLPKVVRERSTSFTVMDGRGHLMMLEDPSEFGHAVMRMLSAN